MNIIESYDYIVIGAGSAGSVIANRLAADKKNNILLLEAGPAEHFLSRVPLGYSKLLRNSKVNWCYNSQPIKNPNGRQIFVPRGK